MSGTFNRDSLPDWQTYADREGMTLHGFRGKWHSTLCDFHDDNRPSLRINTETGGWVCMSCGAKGGDVLAHYMRKTGKEFVQAAQDLGAWIDGPAPRWAPTPKTLSPRDAMEVICAEMTLVWVTVADVARGVTPPAADWERFNVATGRIEALVMEYRS